MISDIVAWLSCPHCATGLIADTESGTRLVCEEGHAFDVARQGYVSLLAGSGAAGTADTAEMVAERAAFLGAGHYDGIADLVAELASDAVKGVGAAGGGGAASGSDASGGRDAAGGGDASGGGGETCLLDLGAGTGYYLARALEAVSAAGAVDSPGIALDVSKHAARLAAKAHPRIGAVVADAWAGLPVRGRAASVLLNVFAPRNPREMRRVLHPAGRAVVVVPEPDHLRELIAEYGLMAVDDRKPERLREQFDDRFRVESEHPYRATLALSADEVSQVIGMGPNAWHERAGGVRSGGAATVSVRAYVLSPR